MKHWIEYLPSGQIVLTGRSPDLPSPERDGAVIEVPGAVDPTRSVFVGDTVFDAGLRPSPMHVLDFELCEWVLWTPPGQTALQAAQEAKWAEVKAARDAACAAPLATPYGVFDADPESRTNITDTVLLLQTLHRRGDPAEAEFTLHDNSNIVVSAEQMEEVGILLGVQVNQAFGIGRALRAAIYAEDAIEASVAALAWPS